MGEGALFHIVKGLCFRGTEKYYICMRNFLLTEWCGGALCRSRPKNRIMRLFFAVGIDNTNDLHG